MLYKYAKNIYHNLVSMVRSIMSPTKNFRCDKVNVSSFDLR